MEDLVLLRAETLEELHARHFAGKSRKRAVNRLAELVRAGYLSAADVVLHGDEVTTRTYTLGPKARAALERRSLCSEHFRFRRWNPTLRDSSIPHQIAVNRVIAELEAPAVPEHLLPVTGKDSARHRPDAVVEGVAIDGDRKLIGIEVDLGHYSKERIRGKVKTWRTYDGAARLVIVTPDEARAQRIKEWVPHTSVFTFEQWREFVPRVRYGIGEGAIFEIDIWTEGAIWPEIIERNRIYQEQTDREYDERLERERRARELAEAEARRAAEQAARSKPKRRRF